MTRKETINRNIGLSFDLLKEIIKNPALLNKIPKAAIVEFVEKDFPKKEIITDPKRRKRKYILVKNEFEVN
jgi:hypothetical protein